MGKATTNVTSCRACCSSGTVTPPCRASYFSLFFWKAMPHCAQKQENNACKKPWPANVLELREPCLSSPKSSCLESKVQKAFKDLDVGGYHLRKDRQCHHLAAIAISFSVFILFVVRMVTLKLIVTVSYSYMSSFEVIRSLADNNMHCQQARVVPDAISRPYSVCRECSKFSCCTEVSLGRPFASKNIQV